MTEDDPTRESDDSGTAAAVDAAGAAVQTVTKFKVLGEFAAANGAGVLGRNTAGTGTPVGVQGEVDAPDGYGLATPDDVRIEGTVDTNGTDYVVEAGTTATSDASNVVMGHASNTATSGTAGATISGGGYDDGSQTLWNKVTGDYGTVGGGRNNTATAKESVIGGGFGNRAADPWATAGGGVGNEARGNRSTIAGGWNNRANRNATVGGGGFNRALGLYSTIAGGGPTDGSNRAATRNVVYDGFGTIGGGGNNRAGVSGSDSAVYATIAGGRGNEVRGSYGAVGGGDHNTASGQHGVVGGGTSNTNVGISSTIGGGETNTVTGDLATVAGGDSNEAHGLTSTVAGGFSNRAGKSGSAKGLGATVAGGFENLAREDYSFAAGRQAKARARGSFVWGDSSTDVVESLTQDEVVFQAGGGVVLWSSSDFSSKVELKPGDNSWTQGSSRTIKSAVDPVDPEEVLAGVESLEVSTWEYDTRPGVRHMGPMAGEFHEAFGLGDDPERISSVDADGVALAAVQGLADRLADARDELDARGERIEDLEAENERLRASVAALRDRVEAVEADLEGKRPDRD